MAQQGGGDTDRPGRWPKATMDQLEQVINETDEIRFGINIDQSAKNLVIDAFVYRRAGLETGRDLRWPASHPFSVLFGNS